MTDIEQQQGLNLSKYQVCRTDGSTHVGGKHHHCDFFVLDIQHDHFARAALRTYAVVCEADYPHLAADIRATWLKAPSFALDDCVPNYGTTWHRFECGGCGAYWELRSQRLKSLIASCPLCGETAVALGTWEDEE